MLEKTTKPSTKRLLLVILLLIITLSILLYNLIMLPNPVDEIKEDIKLCEEYCDQKIEEKGENITKCVFEYDFEPTNVKHEEWELFHCRVYYKNGMIYGKFVGDFEK